MNLVSDNFVELLFDEFYLVKEKQNSKQYNYLGKNKAGLLILVDYKDIATVPEDDMKLLQNIVNAGLLLSMDDISILNIASYTERSFDDLLLFFKPERMIIWDCEKYLQKQNIHLKKHQLTTVKGCNILKADSLAIYINDQKAKLELWNNGIKKLK